jgi:hypothetical protein
MPRARDSRVCGCVGGLGCGYWASEEVALSKGASQVGQHGGLLGSLDTLGDHACEAECGRDADHRFGQFPVPRVVNEVADEGFIDLEDVNREVFEVAQR